jgi:hypothetical protein
MKKLLLLFVVLLIASVSMGQSGCATDADIASQNLSKAADQFEINRRIVFYNGITDTYMLTIEGKCSLDLSRGNVLTVTCMTGKEEFKKHYLGLSHNVTYFAEQLDSVGVSRYMYRVVFKPLSIIPDIDIEK